MNTYIILTCVLAAIGLGQSSSIYGYGGYGLAPSVIHAPLLAPAAVSYQNQWKGSPIPVVKPLLAPIYSAPIYKTIISTPYYRTYPWGPLSWSYGYKNMVWGSPYGYGLGYKWV